MEKRICLNCNQEFYIDRKDPKFCSKKCKNRYYYTHITLHKEKEIVNNVITVKCLNCDKEFTYTVRTNYKKYCSEYCYKTASKKESIDTFNIDNFNKKLDNKIKRNKYLKDEGLI